MREKLQFSKMALLVSTAAIEQRSHTGSHYGTWQMRFVDISRGLEDLDYPSRYTRTGRTFLGFIVRVQWERDQREKGSYAWKFYYDSVDVDDLDVALAHVEMLKKLRRVSQKFDARPSNFGEFVTMYLKGLGVKTYLTVGEPKNNNSWRSLNDYNYQEHKVGPSLVELIESSIDKTYFPEHEQKQAS